ncbi:MAG: hypothetical protein AB7U81_00340 [Thiohalomonadaceae bacterium]
MNESLVCWKCGAAIETDGRFARLEACRQCGAELHVCAMCAFHDPRLVEACTEERAEAPVVKDRANFCDYFRPRPHAFSGNRAGAEAASRAQLEALFGGGQAAAPAEPDEARRALDALFKNPQ